MTELEPNRELTGVIATQSKAKHFLGCVFNCLLRCYGCKIAATANFRAVASGGQ